MKDLRRQLEQLRKIIGDPSEILKQAADSDLAPIDQRMDRPGASDGAAASPPDTHVRTAGARMGQVNPLWVQFLAGMLCTGAAVGLVVLALYIHRHERNQVAVWMFVVFAAVSGTVGGMTLAYAGYRLGQRSQHRLKASRFPEQPWHADYRWDPTGYSDNQRSIVVKRWLVVAVMAAFLLPANVLMVLLFWLPPVGCFLVLFVGIWDVALYVAFRRARRTSAQQTRFGGARLRFEQFPFFLGEMCEMKLDNDKGIGHYQWLTFTLRCMQEKRIMGPSIPIDVGHKNSRTYYLTAQQVWADQFTIERPGDLPAGAPVPLTFLLPVDPALTTRLADDPPRYWELIATGKTDGADYQARFLVPVYARPSATGRV